MSSSVRKNSAFALAEVLRAKSLSLVLVARQRVLYNLDRGVGRPDVIHPNLLAFQLLVVLEKTLQNEQAVRRQFVGLDVAVELRIVGGHGDDLVVAGLGVDHGHQANSARFDERERL